MRRALLAASITAACIFVTTYGSAWVAYRPFVALGRYEPMYLQGRALEFQYALEQYSKEHGHYPNALKDALPKDTDPGHYLDPWNNPYQYANTGKGYRVFSLGRDGKPGGVGLDADFDLNFAAIPNLPVTFSQFLFEGGGSGTLLAFALSASLCAGLACFLQINSPRKDQAISWLRFGFTVLVTAVVAFFVVGLLMPIILVATGR
jgi:hypothetical protein